MDDEITFSSDPARFNDLVAARIRAERHDDAERLLIAELTKSPSPGADLALALERSAVQVKGWPAFNERIEALSTAGKPITAAWLLLSNYTDDAEDGLRHPAIEHGYLRDGGTAFSKQTTEELLASSATYPAPWTGAPDEDGHELEIHGLERLNDWLIKFDVDENDPQAAAWRASVRIAEWFMLLRYHQAIRRELAELGLVRDIPVIVGAHDVGPWCMAIYRRAKPFRIDPHRKPTKKEQDELRASIEWQVGVWKGKRADNEYMYGPFGSAGYLKAAVDTRHMAERWFNGTPFEGLYPLEMTREDFDRFLERWKHYRDPSSYAAPPLPEKTPPPSPERPTSLLGRLFGRKSR